MQVALYDISVTNAGSFQSFAAHLLDGIKRDKTTTITSIQAMKSYGYTYHA